MSHISRIAIEIKSLATLKAACRRLGLALHEGRSHFTRYAGTSACEHVITVPGAAYEVGVVRVGEQYELRWDDYAAGGLVQALGKGAGRLKQAYAIERVKNEARRRGMRLRELPLENKSIRLVLTA